MQKLPDNFDTEQLEFSPLKIEQLANSMSYQIQWKNKIKQFRAEILKKPTPKNIEYRLYLAKQAVNGDNFPLLVTTYLNEDNLQKLIETEISGIDLCGNGVIIADDWFVYRSGNKNNFPSNSPIKNIFRGTSSIIVGLFLLKKEFQNVSEILSELKRRGGKTTLPTVSKVIKTLEEELIVNKEETIKLINPDKLLDKLTLNFRLKTSQTIIGKVANLESTLFKMNRNDAPFVCFDPTRYAISATSAPTQKIYTESIDTILKDVEFDETKRFANLEIYQTNEQSVYFDKRGIYASPLQVYLDLATSGKREQEIAKTLKKDILQGKI